MSPIIRRDPDWGNDSPCPTFREIENVRSFVYEIGGKTPGRSHARRWTRFQWPGGRLQDTPLAGCNHVAEIDVPYKNGKGTSYAHLCVVCDCAHLAPRLS